MGHFVGIQKPFPHHQKGIAFWNIKSDKITFQTGVCVSFIQLIRYYIEASRKKPKIDFIVEGNHTCF